MNHDEYWENVMIQAVNSGFDAAHNVPIAELGIEIDATDAARFFDGL